MFRPLITVLFALSVFAGISEAEQDLKMARGCARIATEVVRQLAVPRCYHEGLYHDGLSIWLSNGEGGKTWVIDPSSGSVSSEITAIGDFTEAITAKGDGTFYTTEWNDKKIYRAKLDGNKLVSIACVSVAPSHPAGAIWNGKRLYVILWDRGILGTRFSIAEMDEEMNILDSVKVRSVQEPCQLAWDGSYLWMTSWYDKRVYKIDVALWKVLGYFCSPVDRTTGIAWDGKYLWLTATYGDLYQVRLEKEN
jgi:glutamine cyclotransferase